MPPQLAVRAEAAPTTSWQTSEYALSLERLRSVGHVMLGGQVEVQQVPDTLQLRAEFDTSLAEMLKTDQEFGQLLQITRFDEHAVHGGEVRTRDGVTKVTDSLRNGFELSSQLAVEDSRMQTQANRDRHDLRNAHEVCSMVRGETAYNTRIVASLMPEEAMERDGEAYWRGLGYFPETKTAFLQMYHVTKDGELLTGTLSVDATDKETMRKLWQDAGMAIPEGEITDNWLQYAITDTLTDEQAKQLVLSLRQQHYANIGYIPTNPTSVEDVLAANYDTVQQTFDELHLPLAEAIASGRKTPAVDALLSGFMPKAMQLGADIRRGLLRAHNKQSFDDQDARLTYKLVMYAAAERIRASIKTIEQPTGNDTTPKVAIEPAVRRHVPPEVFMQQIISVAYQGIAQRRSYGACGAAIDLSETHNPLPKLNPQSVFAGQLEPEEAKPKVEEDEYGPLEFECTEGHTNTRPKGELIDECQHKGCTGSVGCG
jgi:hypothetical protein